MTITAAQKYLLNKELGAVGLKLQLGDIIEGIGTSIAALEGDDVSVGAALLQRKYVAKGAYDFAADGGAIGTFDLGVTIPDNAIITDAWVDVLTTLTSATDAATIALHTETANDIVSAVAISAATDWDAGLRAGIPVGTVATMKKMSAARALTATVAVEDLTAGKFNVFVEYVLSD